MVREHLAELCPKRLLLFRAHADQDAGVQIADRAGILVDRVRRAETNRVANQLQVLDPCRTRPAPAEMGLDCDLLVDRQLTIDKAVEVLACVLASDIWNHVRRPNSSARSVCRARVSRDFTVPTATPSENAISS
jgi:hypothetical protein